MWVSCVKIISAFKHVIGWSNDWYSYCLFCSFLVRTYSLTYLSAFPRSLQMFVLHDFVLTHSRKLQTFKLALTEAFICWLWVIKLHLPGSIWLWLIALKHVTMSYQHLCLNVVFEETLLYDEFINLGRTQICFIHKILINKGNTSSSI